MNPTEQHQQQPVERRSRGDLRRLTMKQLEAALSLAGHSNEEVKSLQRWERVAEVRAAFEDPALAQELRNLWNEERAYK